MRKLELEEVGREFGSDWLRSIVVKPKAPVTARETEVPIVPIPRTDENYDWAPRPFWWRS